LQGRNALLEADSKLYEFVVLTIRSARQKVMPDDHSELVPLLPIPNRTVKRLSADDSAGSRVKVGHRQALTAPKAPAEVLGLLFRTSVRRGRQPAAIAKADRVGRNPQV
jgi:hypothetical protein